MQINYLGQTPGDRTFLSDAFFDFLGTLDSLSPISVSGSTIVFENAANGIRTVISGNGLGLNGGSPSSGTVTGMTMLRPQSPSSQNYDTIGTVGDISWSFVQLWSALEALETGPNFAQLAALYNSSGPITVDASAAASGFGMYDFFDFAPQGQNLNDFITQPMTVTGSDFSDDLVGAQGNDYINPGSNSGGDAIAYTPGNDTLDFSDADSTSFYSLLYAIAPGFTATINSQNNTGSIAMGSFTHTLVDVNAALLEPSGVAGLFLIGSNAADTFNVTFDGSNGFQWLGLRGNAGNDVFNITFDGDGLLRYSFRNSTQGIDANLATGVIQDEEGFTDTLNVSGSGGVIELLGTDFADRMIGSSRDEIFITEQGDDTVNGGGGWDALRYNRVGADFVNVDLSAGTATGRWDGIAFTHTISNLEEVRGTDNGDDTITGSVRDERLEGRNGDDALDGAGGNDTLTGGTGNDTLSGGNGADSLSGGLFADVITGGAGADDIRGGRGSDRINGNDGNDIARGGARNDDIRGSAGADTLFGQQDQDTLRGGADDDVLGGGDGNDLIFGNSGNDLLDGGNGADTLLGGDNNDTLNGKSGDDEIRGGSGNDRAKGGADNDTLDGEGGNDLLFGNLGNDQISGGTGMDTLIGGDGNDRLTGDAGADELRGGTGTDVFVFDSGHGEDTIGDLDVGVDEIEISNALAAGRSEAQIVALGNVVNGDYRIDLGGGDVLVLEDITSDAGLEDMFSIV